MRTIPVTSAQIQAISRIIPGSIGRNNSRTNPITMRISCMIPVFILPPITLPSPGRRMFNTNALIARTELVFVVFFSDMDFFLTIFFLVFFAILPPFCFNTIKYDYFCLYRLWFLEIC